MNQRDNIKHMIRMEKALTFMLENMKTKLKIEEVAAAEGVEYHPIYFAGVFQEYFDMSWKQYYIKLKMRDAARFIQYERISSNIAKRYGYSDGRVFNTAFLREIGMTPAQFLERNAVVPDMPDRKQLCGVPIHLDFKKIPEFEICGVPLYPSKKSKSFDILGDAAYALTCVSSWEDSLAGYPHVGIWSYDQKGKLFYLIGSITNGDGKETPGRIHQTIGAGQYAVFSAERTGDEEEDTTISRMLARYAMMEWRRVNFREADRLGYTFEVFDKDRLYLYLPLLGDFGNNEHWRASMHASLYREYLDAHLTEEIKTGEYAQSVYYTERWLRDSFRQLYGMTPQKYVDARKLKLAARELIRKDDSKEEILKKYHYSSMTVFANRFINCYGAPYRDYRDPDIRLPESIPVRYGVPRKIRVSTIILPRMRAALHPLTRSPEYMEVGDYPGLVTYWFTHEWKEKEAGYSPRNTGNVDKIFLYDIHLFQKKGSRKKRKKDELEYSIGKVLEEGLPQGCREKILEGGRYVQFEMEDDYEIRDLMEIYQQMESSIFLKWYYDNELILSTTKEKLVRYKDGRLYFYLPLEI